MRKTLRQAYPSYFLDTGVFLGVVEEVLAPPAPPVFKRRI